MVCQIHTRAIFSHTPSSYSIMAYQGFLFAQPRIQPTPTILLLMLLTKMLVTHPQVLDDGRITDSQGRVVSFKNSIIIMTSNLGSGAVLDLATQGMAEGEGVLSDMAKAAAKDAVLQSVRGHFRCVHVLVGAFHQNDY